MSNLCDIIPFDAHVSIYPSIYMCDYNFWYLCIITPVDTQFTFWYSSNVALIWNSCLMDNTARKADSSVPIFLTPAWYSFWASCWARARSTTASGPCCISICLWLSVNSVLFACSKTKWMLIASMSTLRLLILSFLDYYTENILKSENCVQESHWTLLMNFSPTPPSQLWQVIYDGNQHDNTRGFQETNVLPSMA